MNKKIKETTNQIESLQRELEFLSKQGVKRLDVLSKQDGPYSGINGQIIQLTQRIADHENFLKTITELIEGGEK